ncbi:MAG TPA: class I SAM-dependent methyltransferase [Pyrinomonadaceae bacterium]|jgi:SAM-dependent methyltransferase|nr:class I SAM-dependent methyltransferase [Pyrinomonadaceae bacterium]
MQVIERPFYGEYAWAYDFIIAPPSAAQCDFIAGLFSEGGAGPGSRVLDAGCGAGSYSIELARRGYEVTGLDASPRLLEEARRRAGGSGVRVTFQEGDLLDLKESGRYDAVLCRGVLNDLLDDESRRRAFASFARALRPGGALVFDVREWEGTLRRKSSEPVVERSVETEFGRLTFRSVTRLEPQTRRLVVAERHTLLADGAEQVSDYTFRMRCWTEDELSDSLARAGFRAAPYFGAYDRSAPPAPPTASSAPPPFTRPRRRRRRLRRVRRRARAGPRAP